MQESRFYETDSDPHCEAIFTVAYRCALVSKNELEFRQAITSGHTTTLVAQSHEAHESAPLKPRRLCLNPERPHRWLHGGGAEEVEVETSEERRLGDRQLERRIVWVGLVAWQPERRYKVYIQGRN